MTSTSACVASSSSLSSANRCTSEMRCAVWASIRSASRTISRALAAPTWGDQSRYRAPGHRHTEVDLGQPEHRVGGGNAEVAGEREREPAADDMPMQPRDRHHFAVGDGLAGAVADLRVVAAFPAAGARESGWVAEVGAGGKRAAPAAEDNRFQIEPLLQTGVEIGHLQQRVLVEAVERLRAV